MLQYVPVVGWSWAMSDIVFLARDWEKDRLQLADGVKQVTSLNSEKLPFNAHFLTYTALFFRPLNAY